MTSARRVILCQIMDGQCEWCTGEKTLEGPRNCTKSPVIIVGASTEFRTMYTQDTNEKPYCPIRLPKIMIIKIDIWLNYRIYMSLFLFLLELGLSLVLRSSGSQEGPVVAYREHDAKPSACFKIAANIFWVAVINGTFNPIWTTVSTSGETLAS